MENYVKKEVSKVGSVYYYNSLGEYHRIDGPAIERANGGKEWWINGIKHREDGPARISDDGCKYWYKNNLLHREDGPAVERLDGYKEWWVNDCLHRLEGPALYSDGINTWYSKQTSWRLRHKIYSKTEHNRLVLFYVLEPRRINLNPIKDE